MYFELSVTYCAVLYNLHGCVSIGHNAAAPESWTLTGRNWDINYSENRVLDKRLSTEEPGARVLPAPAA